MGLDLGDRLGHQVLVLQRYERQVEPDHAADLARPVAGGVDHDLAADRAVPGRDPPFAGRGALDRPHRIVAVDHSAGSAGALGERLGDLGGVDVAVVRVPQPAKDVVGLEEGVALPHRGRRQDLEGQALRRRHLRDVPELRHPVPGMGEADAAARAVADRGVDLRRQRAGTAGCCRPAAS